MKKYRVYLRYYSDGVVEVEAESPEEAEELAYDDMTAWIESCGEEDIEVVEIEEIEDT